MIDYRYPFSLGVVLAIRDGDAPALDRVIDGLRQQSLSKRHWHLTVADERSLSTPDLAKRFSWHPRVSLVEGTAAGPAPLAIRALLAQRTDLVAFVDGRTVLRADFLETVLRLAEENPFVGLFGSHAEIAPHSPSPSWQRPFLRLFGLRPVVEERIAQQSDRRFMPGPSGFVVRREHLRRFGHILRRHPFFQEADFMRHRNDFDFRAALARTVVQAGFSMGLFPALRLARVMQSRDFAERTTRDLLRRDAFSRVIERFVWTGMLPPSAPPTRFESIALRWLRTWQFGRRERLRAAHRAGVLAAHALADTHSRRPIVFPVPVETRPANTPAQPGALA
jgi:hypothetical protein